MQANVPDTLSVVLGVTEFTYPDILSECPLSLIGRKHYCFVVAGRLSEKIDEISLNSNQSSFCISNLCSSHLYIF